jgi:hypothetical protein
VGADVWPIELFAFLAAFVAAGFSEFISTFGEGVQLMELQQVTTARGRRLFHQVPTLVYRGNPCHRATEEAIARLLVDGPTVFHQHARVTPYLLIENSQVVGRCALVADRNLPEHVQVAFFEALPGLHDVADCLVAASREYWPTASKLVVGLNGHLQYGGGFLLDHFDEPPVFGLAYTPAYYADYFSALALRSMVSFRFPLHKLYAWEQNQTALGIDGITVRSARMHELLREVERYTQLANDGFDGSPYWSHRLAQENYELFQPFRFLLKSENLLFAELDGVPIGFLLWHPDFNELVGNGHNLNAMSVLRYRCTHGIKTALVPEIAMLPCARCGRVEYAMLLQALSLARAAGCSWCECGFIFEENLPSINMTRRYFERAFGEKLAPGRRYGMFETAL